jgi:hypothetical protein
VQTLPAITKSLAYQLSRIIRTGRKGDSYIFHQQPTMGSYYSRVDPRTIRFSVGKDVEHASSPGYSADSGEKVVNPQAGESAFPLNARFIMGAGSLGFNPVNGGAALLYPTSGNGVQRHYALGQLWRNTTVATTYHRDRGNQTTRVGDTVPESGSPNPLTTNSARPIVLNRPFKSVAELGYAFRDVPWKSLNLSQDVEGANPQKIPADAALMDLFSLTESPVRAGVINLNTASVEVLTALLAGTDPAPLAGTLAGISQLEAESLAADFRAYLGPRENPLHVIRTAADIARMIQASGTGRQWPKIKREAIVAALADVHNARTWNVLVDVVAQTGRFTSGSKDLAGFSVNAEKRLVMHLAIDRLTGRVVDRLIEPSPEFQP